MSTTVMADISRATDDQKMALQSFNEWRTSGRPVWRLNGYAGTGKTTLARWILDILGAEAHLIAPTGKAARVLTVKTGRPATTIHKLIYVPVGEERDRVMDELSDLLDKGTPESDPEVKRLRADLDYLKEAEGDLKFVKRDLSPPPKFLVVDESSMVSEKIAEDIRSLNTRVILIGDSFQLPPVKAAPGWEEHEPDATLEQVVRTTQEGQPITDAANAIRRGERPVSNGNFYIAGRGELDWDDFIKADIVLCGTNKRRRQLNNGIRSRLGFMGDVKEGERVICLSNNDTFDITNGETFKVAKVGDRLRQPGSCRLVLERDNGDMIGVPVWLPLFQDDSQIHQCPRNLIPLTFGYAITVHKSQGSEWNNVVLCDDWERGERDRWLYTGITRAKERCTLISDLL